MNEQMNNEILLKAMMAEDQMSAIKIYCEETAKYDSQLKNALSDPTKSFDKCWSYIMGKAKQHLQSQSGHVMPNVVFGWAIHYFIEPDEMLEKEVGKIQSLTKKSVKVSKTKQPVKKIDVKNETKNQKEHNASFERMSIFDFMNESEAVDDEYIDEEDDE